MTTTFNDYMVRRGHPGWDRDLSNKGLKRLRALYAAEPRFKFNDESWRPDARDLIKAQLHPSETDLSDRLFEEGASMQEMDFIDCLLREASIDAICEADSPNGSWTYVQLIDEASRLISDEIGHAKRQRFEVSGR